MTQSKKANTPLNTHANITTLTRTEITPLFFGPPCEVSCNAAAVPVTLPVEEVKTGSFPGLKDGTKLVDAMRR